MITHGHITINGRKLDIPSYLVAPATDPGQGPRALAKLPPTTSMKGAAGPRLARPRTTEPAEGRVPAARAQDISLPVTTPQLIVEL
jgi:small subunit ribosomal protein S4